MAGGTHKAADLPNPAPDWISGRMWGEVLTLCGLPIFADLPTSITTNTEGFRKIFDSSEPHQENLPYPWQTTLNRFQKILLLRCLRSDKVTNAMQDFVTEQLGQRFVEPQTSSLQIAFKDSSPISPLIFVLSQVRIFLLILF